ncbi:MAG TPA: Asp-tRNA(Asn)/Glu-tRNA(Gln) amidotransferase subunit GatC [Candidatus Saccharimonadales bacterium]|nr:Asp-tRNA(Asn)/Glu-tRNA(Gln) amidotransferase subunit GatC [Candidatus Saccharimonadales bacterium]
MTQISTDDVRHLAQLSSLQLSDQEIGSLKDDIVNILNYVDLLAELDTENVEPTYQVTGLENIWRSDEIENGAITREQLLALAPQAQDNQVKVPKVL